MNACSHFAAGILDFAAAIRVAHARGNVADALLLQASAMRLAAQYIREGFDEAENQCSTLAGDLAAAAAMLREDAAERHRCERCEWKHGDALLALDYAHVAAALSFCAEYLAGPEAAAISVAIATPPISEETTIPILAYVYQQSDTQTKSGA